MAEKSEIVKLGELIAANAVRVERGVADSTDVGFFSILLLPDSDLTARKLKNAIVRAEKGIFQDMPLSAFLEDPGVSYTALGAWLGDQGLGLALIGLGAQLELWDVVLPSDVGVVHEALFQQMIGMGFVQALAGPSSILSA